MPTSTNSVRGTLVLLNSSGVDGLTSFVAICTRLSLCVIFHLYVISRYMPPLEPDASRFRSSHALLNLTFDLKEALVGRISTSSLVGGKAKNVCIFVGI